MSAFEGSSRMLVTAAAGVVGLGSLAYYIFGNMMNEGSDLLPALELKETQDILTKILERVKLQSVRYARAAQQIQQQIAQQGQQMSDSDVKKNFILPHFESSFQEAEDEILQDFDCDSDELEEAGRYYADVEKDEVVIELIGKLKRLHREFGGESDMNELTGGKEVETTQSATSSSEELTLSKVTEILTKLSDMVGEATDEYCENFINSFGLPQSPDLIQQFQGGMLQMSEKMEAQVLSSFGLSQADFQAGIMAHQADPSLHKVIQDMQVKNQQRLMKHGISMQ